MQPDEKETILSTIRQLIDGTEFQNHVFLVGGAVRDELMGVSVKDLDICVDLPNGGISLAQFITQHQKTVRRGANPQLFKAYGIARFTLKGLEHLPLECVQTRKERYEDRNSRNPVTEFAPLREDCLRRDLTINALYRNISTGEIVDVTGQGVPDLQQHIIRTPREPFLTFDEDALRILRCIRFAARFGWQIEPETLQGIRDCAERLSTITQDRKTEELSRMLIGAHPAQALQSIRMTGVLPYVLPEWGNLTEGQWTSMLKAVEQVPAQLSVRLAALCLFVENTTLCLQRMNYPKDKVKEVTTLSEMVSRFPAGPSLNDVDLRRLQYQWGDYQGQVLDLLQAQSIAGITDIRQRCEAMAAQGTDCTHLHLPVDGRDIMQILGVTPGPQVKEYMNRALELCFQHPGLTKEECLKLLI